MNTLGYLKKWTYICGVENQRTIWRSLVKDNRLLLVRMCLFPRYISNLFYSINDLSAGTYPASHHVVNYSVSFNQQTCQFGSIYTSSPSQWPYLHTRICTPPATLIIQLWLINLRYQTSLFRHCLFETIRTSCIRDIKVTMTEASEESSNESEIGSWNLKAGISRLDLLLRLEPLHFFQGSIGRSSGTLFRNWDHYGIPQFFEMYCLHIQD